MTARALILWSVKSMTFIEIIAIAVAAIAAIIVVGLVIVVYFDG